MRNLTRNGIKLAYEESGAGAPPFLLVHGWCCNRSFFAPQAEYFARKHRVVSVDLRGHGESDQPEGPYPISAYADDLAYMIEKLGLERPIAVGHSMGGITVLQLAASHPESIGAIVMCDPAPLVFTPELRAMIEPMIAATLQGDSEMRRQLITQMMFLPRSDPRFIENVLSVMLSVPHHVAGHAMRGILDFDGSAATRKCKVPALHIAATPPLNPPNMMAEMLPGVVNGWTVGAGHFNQLEAADQVNSMIEKFMRHYL
jgi:pimeloyl-ACP methyl ester carboxylesterase